MGLRQGSACNAVLIQTKMGNTKPSLSAWFPCGYTSGQISFHCQHCSVTTLPAFAVTFVHQLTQSGSDMSNSRDGKVSPIASWLESRVRHMSCGLPIDSVLPGAPILYEWKINPRGFSAKLIEGIYCLYCGNANVKIMWWHGHILMWWHGIVSADSSSLSLIEVRSGIKPAAPVSLMLTEKALWTTFLPIVFPKG